MDNSTDGVTLFSGFISGVVDQYKRDNRVYPTLREMAKVADFDDPLKPAPMSAYNSICDYIERTLGKDEIARAGGVVGAHAYVQMTIDGKLGRKPGPVDILNELKRVADVMIQDPKRRGWVILETTANSVRMRRTQTFNCALQDGLLVSLVERAGAKNITVKHAPCTRTGADFCEYTVTWSA